MLWRIVYLSKFPGLDRKLRVAIDWLEDLMIPKDITGLRTREPSSVRQEHFEAGEWVFHAGDYGDKVYFVIQGELEVVVRGERIGVMKSGDTFGEVALMIKTTRTAGVRAITPADIVSVSREAFDYLVQHVPRVREAMNDLLQQRHGTGGTAHFDGNVQTGS